MPKSKKNNDKKVHLDTGVVLTISRESENTIKIVSNKDKHPWFVYHSDPFGRYKEVALRVILYLMNDSEKDEYVREKIFKDV